jgi:hypothetical protein
MPGPHSVRPFFAGRMPQFMSQVELFEPCQNTNGVAMAVNDVV